MACHSAIDSGLHTKLGAIAGSRPRNIEYEPTASAGWNDCIWVSVSQFLLYSPVNAFSSPKASILSIGGHFGCVLYLTSTGLPC